MLKKFFGRSFAVVTIALTGFVAAPSAYAQPSLAYKTVPETTDPLITLTIGGLGTKVFTLDLSSTGSSNTKTGDFDGFAFNFKDADGDAIPLSFNSTRKDIFVTNAVNNNNPAQNTTAGVNSGSYLCGSGFADCPSNFNFGGQGQGNTRVFDYRYKIGATGGGGGSDAPNFVDQVEFTIDASHFDGEIPVNPFSNMAVRVQSTVSEDGVPAGSFKLNFAETGTPVPEIDGPVLVQVGFALAGLYFVLLGRRRRDDADEMGAAA